MLLETHELDTVSYCVFTLCVCASLQQRRHSQVKRWTKHVDLFSKDFIIIPINEEYAFQLFIAGLFCSPELIAKEIDS